MEICKVGKEYLFIAVGDAEKDLTDLFRGVFKEFTLDKIENAYNTARTEYCSHLDEVYAKMQKERARHE